MSSTIWARLPRAEAAPRRRARSSSSRGARCSTGSKPGYNLKFSLVTIRPQLGLGNFRLSSGYGDPTPGPGAISNYFYLELGVVGLVSLGVIFVGADVGALLLPTGPDSALTVHGQIGVTF
jgi:hypothetical protein